MAKRPRALECWYRQYWAQSWYRNTYLVNRPDQIARQINDERDWNNVYDSGCNFVCLAMILGIDPARLAAELAAQRFFAADRSTRARDISGKIVPLVWDQNAPQRGQAIRLKHLWLPSIARRVTLTLRFVGEELTFDHKEGSRIVARARRRGEHVVAGSREHSHLVAGRTREGDFYLWDPDDTSVAVEDSLAGRLTLASLFRYYAHEPIEFWRYAVNRRIERARPAPSDWTFQG